MDGWASLRGHTNIEDNSIKVQHDTIVTHQHIKEEKIEEKMLTKVVKIWSLILPMLLIYWVTYNENIYLKENSRTILIILMHFFY